MNPDFKSSDMPDNLKAAYDSFLRNGFRLHPGTTPWDEGELLRNAQQVRDVRLREIPILPGAISTFVALASREWAVAGKPRAAARAVETLNETETWDVTTGRVDYGLEQFIRRQAMDYITVGRTAFAWQQRNGVTATPLEYMDPTILTFAPKKPLDSKKVFKYPKDYKNTWLYAGNVYYHNNEVTLHHPLPVGTNRFVPPIYFLMPSATLAWLLQEHNIASLDGRKIRDIFFVANQKLHDSVGNALIQHAAIWSGEPISKIGLPVVHLNVSGNVDISKLVHRMGLSEVPKNFDATQFIDFYTNQIASALGISLRHFWNTSTATTNRSVEEVSERRQESKGPAAFVRSLERQFNACGMLEQFGKGKNKARFGFVEEVDVSTRLGKAEYLERISKSLNLIAKVFGVQINMDSYLAWMQSVDALPADMTLMDASQQGNNATIEKPDDNLTISEDESKVESDPNLSTFEQKSSFPIPDYDEILLSGNGTILDRRRKTFSIFSAIAPTKPLINTVSNKSIWEQAVSFAKMESRAMVKDSLGDPLDVSEELATYVDSWLESQVLFSKDIVESALNKTLVTDEPLNESEQDVIDYIAGDIEEFIEPDVGIFEGMIE